MVFINVSLLDANFTHNEHKERALTWQVRRARLSTGVLGRYDAMIPCNGCFSIVTAFTSSHLKTKHVVLPSKLTGCQSLN